MAPQLSLVTPYKKDWKHENKANRNNGNYRAKTKCYVANSYEGQKIESNSNLQYFVFCDEIRHKG
jgi:hypothetical protein